MGERLNRWLAGKHILKSGINRYETDVRVCLKPHIGDRRLDRLHVSHLSEMFTAIPMSAPRTGRTRCGT